MCVPQINFNLKCVCVRICSSSVPHSIFFLLNYLVAQKVTNWNECLVNYFVSILYPRLSTFAVHVHVKCFVVISKLWQQYRQTSLSAGVRGSTTRQHERRSEERENFTLKEVRHCKPIVIFDLNKSGHRTLGLLSWRSPILALCSVVVCVSGKLLPTYQLAFSLFYFLWRIFLSITSNPAMEWKVCARKYNPVPASRHMTRLSE